VKDFLLAGAIFMGLAIVGCIPAIAVLFLV